MSREIMLISRDANPPGDAHAAQRKSAALPRGGAQSPVRSLRIEGAGNLISARGLCFKHEITLIYCGTNPQTGRQTETYHRLRNSDGVISTLFRKAREKCDMLLKPHCTAISSIEDEDCDSICLA